MEHVLLYLDLSIHGGGTATLESKEADFNKLRAVSPSEARDAGGAALVRRLVHGLEAELNSGALEIVFFHQLGRGHLETQQMMETHCLNRYKGVAHWVAHFDPDEFMEPVQPNDTIRAVVDRVTRGEIEFGALQTKQAFWGHAPEDGILPNSTDVWRMNLRTKCALPDPSSPHMVYAARTGRRSEGVAKSSS